MRRSFLWICLAVLIVGIVVPVGLELNTWHSTKVRQPWVHVVGPCKDGAVLTILSEDCGASGTTFDGDQIYAPSILKDVSTEAVPCPGIAIGSPCYRMWYTGVVADARRIGYAVSSDGVNWVRVPGPLPDGSVFGAGPAEAFDSGGVSVPSVIRDEDGFKMWYTGLDTANEATGFGYALSADGLNWTRIPGPLDDGAVLRASGADGAFDRDLVLTQSVLRDVASAHAPCNDIPFGSPCYRMWYEGETHSPAFVFTVGYAVSADGINWQRVRGPWPDGSVMGTGWQRSYDTRAVGVPMVLKDGALFRMWYEAWGHDGAFSIGYAVSADGLNWHRPTPLAAALSGADDPTAYVPDGVWAGRVLKEGVHYRMWYSLSTRPQSKHIALALLTPGSSLSHIALFRGGDSFMLVFETTQTIPAGGSVLVTLPSGLTVRPVKQSGLGDAPLTWESALTDSEAQGVTRKALLLRVTAVTTPGRKEIHFASKNSRFVNVSGENLYVQIFNTNEVLEYGSVEFP